jgi:L,D-transpeptidase-like protein
MHRRRWLGLLAAAVPGKAFAAFLEWTPPSGASRRPPPDRLRLPPPRLPVGALSAPRIEVVKSRRTLSLFDGPRLVASYRVGLGRRALPGAKRHQGDFRTPEGSYFLCSREPASSWHRFLGISYPGATDARAALAEGTIDRATAEAIESAEASRIAPPWDTPLGGAVGIHGGGGDRDWTAGCIALDDPDLDQVWAACPLGTPIEIRA